MIFDRQLLYWGEKKQRRLSEAIVLIAGMGGIGSFVSQVLVRAGVGKLYIVDDAIIDEPDLNRQILYDMDDIGKGKVSVAAEKLANVHNFTDIIQVNSSIDKSFGIPADVELVVDCLDNFQSRKILNSKLENGMAEVQIACERNYGQIISLAKDRSLNVDKIWGGFFRYDEIIPISADTVGVVASFGASEVINCIAGECKLLNKILFIDLASFGTKVIALE